jgi:hypothetical protein
MAERKASDASYALAWQRRIDAASLVEVHLSFSRSLMYTRFHNSILPLFPYMHFCKYIYIYLYLFVYVGFSVHHVCMYVHIHICLLVQTHVHVASYRHVKTGPVPRKESQQRVARSNTTYIQEVPPAVPPRQSRAAAATFNARVALPADHPQCQIKKASPHTAGKERAKLSRQGLKNRRSPRLQTSVAPRGMSSGKEPMVSVHVAKVLPLSLCIASRAA